MVTFFIVLTFVAFIFVKCTNIYINLSVAIKNLQFHWAIYDIYIFIRIFVILSTIIAKMAKEIPILAESKDKEAFTR